MRIAALQTDIHWENPPANFAALGPRLAEARDAGARLLVLPEMYACGFSMRTAVTAEAPDGPSTAFLRDAARDLGVWVGGSVPVLEPGRDRPFNTFLLAGPGEELHRYRKIHPFTHDGEHEHYAAGSELVTVEVEGVRFSLFVCYDLRFADELWLVADRTDVYLVVANWPAARRTHWTTLLGARAIENQAFVVGVNRVGAGGAEGQVAYAGDSRVVDPWGEVPAAAGDGPAILLADVDPACVREARTRFPVLRDRRRGDVLGSGGR